ncbi:MAG: alpha-ketoglutarate-dependent dioxygenase AlkB, partial [Alicycliphilus sp.]|nr:alpha-ketoglutarate-dependent dioxygenase AlkB [Alicycliphilus sp.]
MPHQPIDDLFADDSAQPTALPLGTQAVLLRGFALAQADALVQGVQQVAAQAPWRHMLTPGGQAMSVAMTGCGPLSWVSDRRSYRYA